MSIKIFLLLSFLSSSVLARSQSLSGHVIDSTTHLPIVSASVYLPQLNLGAVSVKNGYYKISSLPKGIYDIQVQAHGYSTIIQQVNISTDVTLDRWVKLSS